jgi:hypothetical protein
MEKAAAFDRYVAYPPLRMLHADSLDICHP